MKSFAGTLSSNGPSRKGTQRRICAKPAWLPLPLSIAADVADPGWCCQWLRAPHHTRSEMALSWHLCVNQFLILRLSHDPCQSSFLLCSRHPTWRRREGLMVSKVPVQGPHYVYG